jgi:excisionase family DNA binding protein
MRKKFRPETAGCLVRMEAVEESGETFSVAGETYFTPVQLAYLLDTSHRTVATLTSSGRIAHTEFGKVIRYRKSDVLAFIGALVSV